jgi:hypothetical protein
MSDERAKRAAEKMNDWYGGMLAMPIDDQKAIDNTAPIIAAEYAPVIAERDRLKKQVERLKDLLRDAAGTLRGRGWVELQIKIDAALQEQPND